MWRRERSKRLDLRTQRAALRKLLILDAADVLDDHRVPPGNRLEKLRGPVLDEIRPLTADLRMASTVPLRWWMTCSDRLGRMRRRHVRIPSPSSGIAGSGSRRI